ncbi:helix-turn-helix transcriptional regulator [Serratia marcescens]|uniref:LexA family transcriptional regulator n=1 Tax=Serratia marcescens TaxID=615 RepID=UPI00301B81DB
MTTVWLGCNLLPMVENNKYKGFSERLSSLMNGKNIGVTELAKKAGVTYEMARRYTLGTAKPRSATMEKLAKSLDTTASYLEYGAVAQLPEQSSGNQVRLTQLEVFASAGNGYINNEFPAIVSSIEFPESRVYELFGRKSLEGVQLINVDGDSMMPTLCPKDLLFIDTKIDHFNGDGVYVFNFEDSTFVKRLQKVKGRKLAVLSDNDKYPPFYIEPHEMTELYIFGKLIKHLPLKFNDFA